MGDVVVDASVWVSRTLASDAHHRASVAWFARVGDEDAFVIAPAIMPAEVSGALARRVRSSRLAHRVLDGILRTPSLILVPVDRSLGEHAARLAVDLRLRGSDAMYVAVAHRLSIPLVTLDAQQLHRGQRAVQALRPS